MSDQEPVLRIWGGGPFHPTRAQAQLLAVALSTRGLTVDYTASVDGAFDLAGLGRGDLLVLMGLHWSGLPELATASGLFWEEAPNLRYQGPSEAQVESLREYLHRGGGLLGIHAGIASFDDLTALDELLPGRWRWGESWHAPYQPIEVLVSSPLGLKLAEGTQRFGLTDEFYLGLEKPTNGKVCLKAVHAGASWPLAWTIEDVTGRRGYLALGHDQASFKHPVFMTFLTNMIDWLLQRPFAPDPAPRPSPARSASVDARRSSATFGPA